MKKTGEENKDTNQEKLFLSDEMKSILDCSYDGIWVTDGEGKVLYVNATNEKMIGISRDEMVGKYCEDLVNKKFFQSSATMEVMKSKKPVSVMGYNYKTQMHVLITSNPIFDADGNMTYIINNVRDMTQIKQTMTQIQKKDKVINEQRQEIENLLTLKNEEYQKNEDIIVVSKKMEQVMDCARRVGRFDSTVLVLGESGVGKEVIAKDIVRTSKRADKPFVKVNCGAIPENLLESELFGYEKGAFTGADKNGKMGMFELANTGTIFLDEVADLPLHLQVKLLRVLQEREVIRVGGVKPILLDVRVIAATNGNLEDMVQAGTFRKDLYYRLNVVSIEIPPLRERREDIPQMIQHFAEIFCTKHQIHKEFMTDTIRLMMEYEWPGNIRELQNVVENLIIMTNDAQITPDCLSSQFLKKRAKTEDFLSEEGEIIPLKEALQNTEKILISRAIEKYKSTRAAAEALGVNQSTIVRKMQSLKEAGHDIEE